MMSDKPFRIKASSEVTEAGEEGKLETRTVPMKLYIPDDIPILYADQFNLFFSDYDFTLSFFQTQAPLITNDTDWDTVEAIQAKCVTRLLVPPHMIPRILNVLSENWQRFMQARQAQIQERENVSKPTEAGAGDAPSEGGV